MRTRLLVAACAALAGAGAAGQERGEITMQAIRDHAAQTSAVWTQRAHAMASAMDGMLQAELRALTDREESRAMVAHAPAEGVCEALEGTRGIASARLAQQGASSGAGEATVAWLVRDTARVPGMSAASDMRARVDLVLDRYCAPGRMPMGEGSHCAGAWEEHAGDLHPGALFAVDTFRDEEAALVAADWARNVTMPVPETGSSWASAGTALERRATLDQRAAQARAALAAGYVQERVSARIASVSAASWAKAMGAGDAGDDNGRLSAYALLGLMARGRLERPDVLVRLQAQDDANLLRELIVSEAAALALDFERFRDEERRGALLAARLGRALERERRL